MRSTTKIMTAFGETKSLKAWTIDNRCTVNYQTLYNRVCLLGWNTEQALVAERRPRNKINTYREEKFCPACQRVKPVTLFYKNRVVKDGLQSYCIPCCAEHNKKNTKNSTTLLRLQAINHLGARCVDCGFSDIRALQIDHVNGGGSHERKMKGSNRFTYKNALEDISGKYQVLCANCNWIKKAVMKENGGYFNLISVM